MISKPVCLVTLMAGLVLGLWDGIATAEGNPDTALFSAEFFKLCDLACEELPKENLHKAKYAFFRESYAVRALAVAYDMTGDEQYLNVCKQWSDRMAAMQKQMDPQGAYYMNYHRKPGEKKGQWYVADSACIGLAVLTTAIRCNEEKEYRKYLDSVESFARLVMTNYVDSSGGIRNGLWEKFDGPWWCSTGSFGSLTFLLYGQTGKEEYLKVGQNALDWLNQEDFRSTQPYPLTEMGPSMIMYYFETHATAWPYLQKASPRQIKSANQMDLALDWLAQHQEGRGGKNERGYHDHWGCKMAGTPFLMNVYSWHVPDGFKIRNAADQELKFVLPKLVETSDDPNRLKQLMAFAMFSLAQRLSPGAIYRTSFRTSAAVN